MNIFISYRRSDTPDVSGRIYDELARRFGDETVFKDVDDIPLGVNFSRFLNDIVQQSSVMLIVIGLDWLDVTDERGQRRLDQPDDFVRIEVKAALEREIPIIPLLVQGAPMPQQGELPEELATLSLYNGIRIRPDPDFHWDMGRLIRQLERYVTPKDVPPKPPETTLSDDETGEQVDQAQLAALYTDARSAYYTGQWQRAADLLSEIVSQQEGYGRAAEMLEEAKRQRTLSERYTLGDDAYAAGRWGEAIEHLEAVVILDPEYQDAATKLQEAKRQQRLADLYADARQLHRAERWAAVVQVFADLHEIEPGYADVDGLLASARAAVEAEERVQKLAALYDEGLSHVDAEEWSEARGCFERIAQLEPGYRETEALLARVRQEIATATSGVPLLDRPAYRPTTARLGAHPSELPPSQPSVATSSAQPSGEPASRQWVFLLAWVLASAASFAFAWPVVSLRMYALGAVVASAVGGAIEWLLLRKRVHGSGWWILASTVGWVASGFVCGIVDGVVNGVVGRPPFSPWGGPYTYGVPAYATRGHRGGLISLGVVMGVVAGVVVGTAQWLVLHRKVDRFGRWLLASIASGVLSGFVGGLVTYARGADIYGYVLGTDLLLAGAVAGVLLGAITGVILLRLLRHPLSED